MPIPHRFKMCDARVALGQYSAHGFTLRTHLFNFAHIRDTYPDSIPLILARSPCMGDLAESNDLGAVVAARLLTRPDADVSSALPSMPSFDTSLPFPLLLDVPRWFSGS